MHIPTLINETLILHTKMDKLHHRFHWLCTNSITLDWQWQRYSLYIIIKVKLSGKKIKIKGTSETWQWQNIKLQTT